MKKTKIIIAGGEFAVIPPTSLRDEGESVQLLTSQAPGSTLSEE